MRKFVITRSSKCAGDVLCLDKMTHSNQPVSHQRIRFSKKRKFALFRGYVDQNRNVPNVPMRNNTILYEDCVNTSSERLEFRTLCHFKNKKTNLISYWYSLSLVLLGTSEMWLSTLKSAFKILLFFHVIQL